MEGVGSRTRYVVSMVSSLSHLCGVFTFHPNPKSSKVLCCGKRANIDTLRYMLDDVVSQSRIEMDRLGISGALSRNEYMNEVAIRVEEWVQGRLSGRSPAAVREALAAFNEREASRAAAVDNFGYRLADQGGTGASFNPSGARLVAEKARIERHNGRYAPIEYIS